MTAEYLTGKVPFYSVNGAQYYMKYSLDALVVYRVLQSSNQLTDLYVLNGNRWLDPCEGSSLYPETAEVNAALNRVLLLETDIPFFVREWIQYYASINYGHIVIRAMEDRESRLLASFIVQENNYWKTVLWNIKDQQENELLRELTLKAQRALLYELNRRF